MDNTCKMHFHPQVLKYNVNNGSYFHVRRHYILPYTEITHNSKQVFDSSHKIVTALYAQIS